MRPQVPKIPSRHCLPITFHDIHFWACVPSRFSRVRLFATLWTVVPQAPLSVAFSKQEYWSGCHFHLQGIFQTQGSNPRLLRLLHWQVGPLPLAPHVYLQSCTVWTVKTEGRSILYFSGTNACVRAQSCPTVWDPMDCSPPDSSVPGILQARILD